MKCVSCTKSVNSLAFLKGARWLWGEALRRFFKFGECRMRSIKLPGNADQLQGVGNFSDVAEISNWRFVRMTNWLKISLCIVSCFLASAFVRY